MVKRIICIIILLICISCTPKTKTSFYISPDYDFSFIKRVAVLPFENFTNEKFASSIITQVVINELLGLVDVAPPGDVVSALQSLKITPGSSLTTEQIKAISKTLDIQAVIFGSVNKYAQVTEGYISYPEISITLMMADATSGRIIWSVTKTTEKPSFWVKHFGAKGDTMSSALEKVVREAIKTLHQLK